MSIRALNWAFKQSLPSSQKFVLVAMADCASDEDFCCYPSIERLASKTSLNRKTVWAAIRKLKETGYLHDTGETRGYTKSVHIYQIRQPSIPKNGQASAEREACPNLDRKHAQNRDTEPSDEPSIAISSPSATPTVLFTPSVNGEEIANAREARSSPSRLMTMEELEAEFVAEINGAGVRQGREEANPLPPKPPPPAPFWQHPLGQRIAAIFRRRPTTPWSEKEQAALRKIWKALNPEDLGVIEHYYENERRKKENYCRRELYTFLNNYQGELDKAKLWEEVQNRPRRSLI